MLMLPLFVCHANCCRSVLAKYLYEQLCPGYKALSAGMEVGEQINDRAAAMLKWWGIDASRHKPQQISLDLCDRADSIFFMGPEYLLRLKKNFGPDLLSKSYLFADPFHLPESFANGAYLVYDPSFDNCPIHDLIDRCGWFRDRVLQIHNALKSGGESLIPASRYEDVLERDLISDQGY